MATTNVFIDVKITSSVRQRLHESQRFTSFINFRLLFFTLQLVLDRIHKKIDRLTGSDTLQFRCQQSRK